MNPPLAYIHVVHDPEFKEGMLNLLTDFASRVPPEVHRVEGDIGPGVAEARITLAIHGRYPQGWANYVTFDVDIPLEHLRQLVPGKDDVQQV